MDRELIIAALRFRACALFKELDDSQIFAVRLPNGTIGYCCCMGHGGEHYALALYKGSQDFSTYLNITSCIQLNPVELFERNLTFHMIQCDFENAADCVTDKKEREFIKKVAKEEGLKICRPKGWPDFVEFDGSVQKVGIDNEADRRDMEFVLQAGCEVARKIKGLSMTDIWDLGFDPYYPTDEEPKTIPLLTRLADGTWHWEQIKTPHYQKVKFEAVKFDRPMAPVQLKGMEQLGTFLCRIIHSPIPVTEGNTRYYPVELLTTLSPEGELPFIPQFTKEVSGWEAEILDSFVENIKIFGTCPKSIETDDRRTYMLLEDFCKKTGIALHLKKERIKSLDEFMSYMMFLMG